MFIDRLQFLHLLDQAVQVVRHYGPFRHQDLPTQQHSVTSQRARAFSSTTIRTSNLTVSYCFKNATVNTEENYDKLQPEKQDFKSDSYYGPHYISSLIHILDHITLHYIPGQDMTYFNPLNTKLNPSCHFLALLGAHHILHISRIRVKEVYQPQ